MINITQQDNDVLIAVKAVPNASRDKIVGELGGALKITITAAPERGAANKAICKFIAKKLGLRTQQVAVETGQSSPRKIIRISETTEQNVRDHLFA